MFCKSAEDLQQRALAISAAIQGQNGGARMTPGCTMLQARTPVDVLDRSNFGRTQVRVRATGETGWTDVWLPAQAPSTQ
ncbi:MAG: hypothetical protein WDN49_18445 [Acetobacteraceae bacterium]